MSAQEQREPSSPRSTYAWAVLAPFQSTFSKLESIHWGKNTLLEWIYTVGSLLLVWALSRGVHAIVEARLRRNVENKVTGIQDVVVHVIAGTKWFFHAAVSVLVVKYFLQFGVKWTNFTKVFLVVTILLQVGVWTQRLTWGLTQLWASRSGSSHGATAAAGVQFIARLLIWIVVALLILANLGVKISAVVAGLGVGGIAAALAVQSILSDLFAGLSMYFDRPFDIGDAIAVDQVNGKVLHIGLRTTRIVATSGEEIVLPNGDLVKARIRNFARLRERRVVFSFGLEYGTPSHKLELARDLVVEIINGFDGLRLDRAHFKGLGASSLEFEVIYFVRVADYKIYMDLQEHVLLSVYRKFEEQGLAFAFPSQTLYLRDEDAPKRG